MNLFLKQLTVSIISALLFQFFLPWWTAVLAGFLSAWFFKKSTLLQSLAAAFFGVFLVWTMYALFIDVQNQSLLSEKIAALLSLPSSWILILITGIIGGITAALGAWVSNALKAFF